MTVAGQEYSEAQLHEGRHLRLAYLSDGVYTESWAATFINGGLARTVSPELAISVFAVAWTLVQFIDSASSMFHQIILNFMEDDYSNRANIRKFGVYVAAVLTALIAVLGYTPVGFWLMNTAIGTSVQLSQMGVTVIRICIVVPVMGVIRQYYWGIAMKERKTVWLTIGSGTQSVAMIFIIVLLTVTGAFPTNPALVGAGLLLLEAQYLNVSICGYRDVLALLILPDIRFRISHRILSRGMEKGGSLLQ